MSIYLSSSTPTVTENLSGGSTPAFKPPYLEYKLYGEASLNFGHGDNPCQGLCCSQFALGIQIKPLPWLVIDLGTRSDAAEKSRQLQLGETSLAGDPSSLPLTVGETKVVFFPFSTPNHVVDGGQTFAQAGIFSDLPAYPVSSDLYTPYYGQLSRTGINLQAASADVQLGSSAFFLQTSLGAEVSTIGVPSSLALYPWLGAANLRVQGRYQGITVAFYGNYQQLTNVTTYELQPSNDDPLNPTDPDNPLPDDPDNDDPTWPGHHQPDPEDDPAPTPFPGEGDLPGPRNKANPSVSDREPTLVTAREQYSSINAGIQISYTSSPITTTGTMGIGESFAGGTYVLAGADILLWQRLSLDYHYNWLISSETFETPIPSVQSILTTLAPFQNPGHTLGLSVCWVKQPNLTVNTAAMAHFSPSWRENSIEVSVFDVNLHPTPAAEIKQSLTRTWNHLRSLF